MTFLNFSLILGVNLLLVTLTLGSNNGSQKKAEYFDDDGKSSEDDYVEEDEPFEKYKFQYWPSHYYKFDKRKPLPMLTSKDQYDRLHWPPRDQTGKVIETAEEWYAMLAHQTKQWEEMQSKLQEDLKAEFDPEDRFLPRQFSYCTDGKLSRSQLPDPLTWAKRHKGRYPFQNINPHLERFIPILRSWQPNHHNLQRSPDGVSYSNNYENGRNIGSYITHITPMDLRSPDGHIMKNWMHIHVQAKVPLEGLYFQMMGWPMGVPFGQFRTDFECDMENNLPPYVTELVNVTGQNPQQFWRWDGKSGRRKRQEIVAPCKYNYGDNAGGEFPSVFAYGGSVPALDGDTSPDAIRWPRKSQFRMHFTWANQHCNYKLRFQFLVIAVREFATMRHEVLLASSDILSQQSISGITTPYSSVWKDGMKCVDRIRYNFRDAVSKEAEISKKPFHFYDDESSSYAIFPNSAYDNCIVASGYEEDYIIEQAKKGLPIDTNFIPSPTGRKSGLGPFHNCDERKVWEQQPFYKEECLAAAASNLCAPFGHPCLEDQHPGERSTVYRFPDKDFFNKVRTKEFFVGCNIQICPKPENSEVGWIVEEFPDLGPDDGNEGGNAGGIGGIGTGTNTGGGSFTGGSADGTNVGGSRGVGNGTNGKFIGDIDDDDEYEDCHEGGKCIDGSLRGTKLSENMTKGIFTKGSVIIRRSKSMHTWTMFFAWMTLMGLGSMTARYFKETGALNPEAKNGFYGLGFWLWFHFLLFIASLTFLWIGLIYTFNVRRRPIPCNAFELYSGTDGEELKLSCRYSRQIVRVHNVLGVIATFLYHMALLVAWTRPTGTLILNTIRFSLRSIGIWVHVICAYFAKTVCICAVIVFFFPRAVSICTEVPIWVVATLFASFILSIIGCILQLLDNSEDKKVTDEVRSKIPVLEAVEVSDKSKYYKCKVIYAIVAVIVQVLLFSLMCYSTVLTYGKSSRAVKSPHDKEGQGHVETLQGIFTNCRVPSLASEEDVRLTRYYRSDDFRDS